MPQCKCRVSEATKCQPEIAAVSMDIRSVSVAEEDRMEAHRDKPATQSVSAATFSGRVGGARGRDQDPVVEVRMTACSAALMGIKRNLQKASQSDYERQE